MADRIIKVEWCENWIRRTFEKISGYAAGIETGCFWKMAEESGLWIRGTYGSPMSQALESLAVVESILDGNEKYMYSVFRLKERSGM